MATKRNIGGGTNRDRGGSTRKTPARSRGPVGPAPGANASAAEKRAYVQRARDRGYAVYESQSPSGATGWVGERKAAPRSANYKPPSKKRK